MAEALERLLPLAEFEERFAQSGESVLVVRIEDKRFLEAASRPGVVLAGVVCVANSNVELHRIRVETESLSKYVQSFVILPFIVQLMGSLVVLFRTQKRCWHATHPPRSRV